MRAVKTIFILAGWILSRVAFATPPGGVLSGVVVDSNGKPIPNALVLYRSVQTMVTGANGRPVASGPLIGSSINTAADGSFVVSGLPPAAYELCAYGVKNTDLGSCEWGQGSVRADLTSGQPGALNFQIADGAMLTFQVEDPKHLIQDLADLQTASAKLPLIGANFAIGIWAGTRYARATLVSTTGATREYQLAIPNTASVRLFLDTSLAVADATGAAIPVRQPSMSLAARAQAEVIINLTIQ